MFALLATALVSRLRNVLAIAGIVVVGAIAGAYAPGAAAADTITVTGATRYQTMTGWETHARGWEENKVTNAYDPSWRTNSVAVANQMVALGINRIQVPLRSGWLNPTDYWAQFVAGTLSYTQWDVLRYQKINGPIQFSDFDFRIETMVLPMAAALAARGEKLYVNLGVVDFNVTKYLPYQGTLSLAANPDVYATFVLAFVNRLKTKYGITADALELNNEPENTAWTGTQMGAALVAAKAKLVAAGYPGLNYIGPSMSSSSRTQAYTNAILAVPGAAAALTTISYHRYDSPGTAAIATLDAYAKSKGLKLNMSEWINATADTLIEDLTVGNVSSLQKWAIATRTGGGSPQAFYYTADLTNPASPVLRMAPNTTFIAQYFRFVRLGAVRIAAQSSVATRRPVAFINTNGNYVVVVKTTAGTGAAAVAVSGLPPGTYGVRTTNFSELASDLPDVVAAANGSLTLILPEGFTTIYGKSASAPPPPPTAGQLSITGSTTFANQTVGTTSAAKSVTVSNIGATAVSVQNIVSSNAAEFPIANSTCVTVNPAASCTFAVAFKPTATGARTATLTIASNGAGSAQTLPASGTGATATTSTPSPGALSFTGTTTTFASQPVGITSAAKIVTVTNTSGTAVSVQDIESSNYAEFPVMNSTCSTVNPGASCTFAVAFKPAAAGVRTSTLTVLSNGGGSAQTLPASGTGASATTQGRLSFPGTTVFASQPVRTAGAATTITVSNVGGTAVAVQRIASSNPSEFAITSSTCGTVNPAATCAFAVVFKPARAGSRTATLTIKSNGVSSPQVLIASGTGTGFRRRLSSPDTMAMVEYYHAEWDHYFVTGIADEIAKLDDANFTGWTRTGLEFVGLTSGGMSGSPVCRFFSTAFGARSSHFYASFAEECKVVAANPDWSLEGDVFNISLPSPDGSCAAEMTPVYRMYNDGQGAAPNHRFTTDPEVRAQMLEEGWIAEGYGPLGVSMCASDE